MPHGPARLISDRAVIRTLPRHQPDHVQAIPTRLLQLATRAHAMQHSKGIQPGEVAEVIRWFALHQHVVPFHFPERLRERPAAKQVLDLPDRVIQGKGIVQTLFPQHQLLPGDLHFAKSAHPQPSIPVSCRRD